MGVTLTWPGFALVAVGAAAAELPAMVYFPEPLPEGYLCHCTNEIRELSCWAQTMKAQMGQNTAKAGTHCMAHLCTWRGVPFVTSSPRVLEAAGLKSFV